MVLEFFNFKIRPLRQWVWRSTTMVMGKSSGELIWDAREDVVCIAARTITTEMDETIEETCATV